MGTDCIFCQMARNEIPCHIIDSNNDYMAFLTIFPNTLGAAVVIPKNITQVMLLIWMMMFSPD